MENSFSWFPVPLWQIKSVNIGNFVSCCYWGWNSFFKKCKDSILKTYVLVWIIYLIIWLLNVDQNFCTVRTDMERGDADLKSDRFVQPNLDILSVHYCMQCPNIHLLIFIIYSPPFPTSGLRVVNNRIHNGIKTQQTVTKSVL